MWEINGLQIEFDIEDLETAEKLDNALLEMQKEEKNVSQNSISMAKAIKSYCAVIRHFFEAIFGNETTDKIFEGVRINQRLYDEIFASFCELADNQKIARDERAKRLQRYVPKKR